MSQIKRGYRHRDVGGHQLRPETLMMSYGYDPQFSEGSVKCPLFQTSTFAFRTAEDGKSFFELAYGLREQRPTEEPGLIYSRVNNPDLEILEDRLGPVGRGRGGPGLLFRHGGHLDHDVQRAPAGRRPRRQRTGLRRHRVSRREHPAAVRRSSGVVRVGSRRTHAGRGRRQGRGARPRRHDLRRDAGQSDQRPGGHRQVRRGRAIARRCRAGAARSWPSTTRSSARSGSTRCSTARTSCSTR